MGIRAPSKNTGRKPSPRRRSDRKLGRKYCFELRKVLNRFPIQNRRDQTRQQGLAGTARRHHDGTATEKLGRKYRFELRKVLNRFPIQNRRDQARQQGLAGTARRFPIQNRRDQARQQAPAGTARHFLIQNRRDQARQQGLAGTARLDGEKGRWYTEIKNRRTLCGLILTTIHSR